MLFLEENKDTYRTLSEENIKLQAEVMQYKVQGKKTTSLIDKCRFLITFKTVHTFFLLVITSFISLKGFLHRTNLVTQTVPKSLQV